MLTPNVPRPEGITTPSGDYTPPNYYYYLLALERRVISLEEFICHHGALVNEWARSCPFGTKLTDHIKCELNRWLKQNNG